MRRALPIILFFVIVGTIVVIATRPWWNKAQETHVILISKGIGSTGYERYGNWLQEFYPGIQCINTYRLSTDSIHALMSIADGLLLSGGPDVAPYRYHRSEDSLICEDIDLYRDSLEYWLIEEALARKMPILGICRGLQILNVYLGGTLFADIPSQFPSSTIHRCEKLDTCFHPVDVRDGTFLRSVVNVDEGTVNTSHHQGIRDLAPTLSISTYSHDQLPEAIEWQDHTGKGFLLATQWHPERLSNQNPMSYTIAKRFVGETFAYKMFKKSGK